MGKFYEETLLKEEFNLIYKLQKDAEFSKYASVLYEDRNTGEERSVLHTPSGLRYPETYTVTYRMPVYTGIGQLRRDWEGIISITLEEAVLTNKHAHHAPHIIFKSNFRPFNNHVLENAICTGNAWTVAKDNGIWHFIISLGALINQDEFVSAERGHYNPSAFDYWISRRRSPVTNIKWPLDLLIRDEKNITIVSKEGKEAIPKNNPISIIPKITMPVVTTTPQINIVSKSKQELPKIQIIEKKK